MAKCLLVEGASEDFLDALQQLVQAYKVDLSQGMPSVGVAAQNVTVSKLRAPSGIRNRQVTTPKIRQWHTSGAPPHSPPAPKVDMALTPPLTPRDHIHEKLEGNGIRFARANPDR